MKADFKESSEIVNMYCSSTEYFQVIDQCVVDNIEVNVPVSQVEQKLLDVGECVESIHPELKVKISQEMGYCVQARIYQRIFHNK
jgi:hypothetical protein